VINRHESHEEALNRVAVVMDLFRGSEIDLVLTDEMIRLLFNMDL